MKKKTKKLRCSIKCPVCGKEAITKYLKYPSCGMYHCEYRLQEAEDHKYSA